MYWKRALEEESARRRDAHVQCDPYERKGEEGRDYRNGFYQRDFVTRLGVLRLKIARTRQKEFLAGDVAGVPAAWRRGDAADPGGLLTGDLDSAGGRVVAVVSGEAVSAQTVSKLTRGLDHLVKAFHQARLQDEWAYLFLDGVSLRVRRPGGRKRVQMLVAYGVRRDGSRQLLAFLRSQGESQAAWEGLLQDLYRRGLVGEKLLLVVTDGCPGLAAALQTVYPRVPHQRCWVHKMRNILEHVRKRDYAQVKGEVQAIYRAESRGAAQAAFEIFRRHWQSAYPAMVKKLGEDLPELLAFYRFPRQLWKPLRTTNAIERRFVEVRRRTRPMVCFVNVESVDRIIFSIFNRFNAEWKNRTLRLFTQAA